MDEPLQEEILTLQGEQKFAPVGKLGALAKAMVGAHFFHLIFILHFVFLCFILHYSPFVCCPLTQGENTSEQQIKKYLALYNKIAKMGPETLAACREAYNEFGQDFNLSYEDFGGSDILSNLSVPCRAWAFWVGF